ncbi:hypothetical protein ACFV4P_03340 [Kitasatospora sp. NPDC059795]|uniref:hypothetical protein n=1 Tax=Kitasatospora sp. NPDC059795 TaxID=3346949 RepID=UPI0036605948
MAVSAFLVLGTALGTLIAFEANGTPYRETPEYAASQTTGLRTDLAPMVKRFHRFGELESAQFVMFFPGSERDLVPMQEHPLHAVLHLKPGQVDRLLAGRTSRPASAPTFNADDMPAGGTGLPASLAPYVPANASWVAAPELAKVLVLARGEAEVSFDPASDTVLIYCVNPQDPDEPTPSKRPDGSIASVTPSPFVLPS